MLRRGQSALRLPEKEIVIQLSRLRDFAGAFDHAASRRNFSISVICSARPEISAMPLS